MWVVYSVPAKRCRLVSVSSITTPHPIPCVQDSTPSTPPPKTTPTQDEDFIAVGFGLPLEPPGLPLDLQSVCTLIDSTLTHALGRNGLAKKHGDVAKGMGARLRFRKTLLQVCVCVLMMGVYV